MLLILFTWRLWLTSVLFQAVQAVVKDAQFEKHSSHDKNWWLWNLEAKEKPLITSSQDKEEKDDPLRSAHHLEHNSRELNIISKWDPSKNVRKRWLSNSFSFGSKKNLNRESKKWQIDTESSGSNSQSGTRVIQEPWISKIRPDPTRMDVKHSKKHSKYRGNKKFRPRIVLQQRNFERHPSADNILFRSSNLTDYMKDLGVNERSQTRLPLPSVKTYGDLNPLTAVRDRYVTPFTELKFNPFGQPYPFHDPRSSIPWYTTNGWRKGEPTHSVLPGQQLALSKNEDVMSKEVAKYRGKSSAKRGKEEFKLIPKVFAVSQHRNRKKQKASNQYGWYPESFTNPIIVPGFKRKYMNISTPGDKPLRPYLVRAGNQVVVPFDDEYVQASRANRNQTKNENFTDQKLTVNGPLQFPNPYGFPGGVNISILVPNPPAPSYDAPLSTTSMSTEKNSKKKKERKKKVKSDDSLNDDVMSAPRAQVVTTNTDVIYDQLNAITKSIKYSPPLMRYPVLDFRSNNFSLLNHIRNVSLDQVYCDSGVQTEIAKKAETHNEFDDDVDEIRMLYDEQTSSKTTERLETVSFAWYRFTDFMPRIPNQGGEKFRPSPSIERYAGSNSSKNDYRSGKFEKILRRTEGSSDISSFGKPLRNEGFNGKPKDQWDVLDEDLKNIATGNIEEVAWQLKNRKREADYYNRDDDLQGFYRLSPGENSFRNPTNLIVSAFRRRKNQPRDKDYYDESPEHKIRGRVRTEDEFQENTE